MIRAIAKYKETILIAVQSLTLHKTRSLLTMLGIIFGVGAVIAMLSIGEGARQETLEQIEVLGIRNVLIRSIPDEEVANGANESNTRPIGLSLKDANAIKEICAFTERIAPTWENTIEARTIDGSMQTTLIGATPEYADIFNLKFSEGAFLLPHHLTIAANVCVLGQEVKKELFGFSNAVSKLVKLQDQWFTVLGVIEEKKASTLSDGDLHSANAIIIIPITTAMAKYPREVRATSRFFGRRRFRSNTEEQYIDRSTVDQIAVQIMKNVSITEAARIISDIVQQRHNGQRDFVVTIPEELIAQSQRTQNIFNIVMGAIAGISLLVGGIGIMNIMLASVLERTREIGVRRAIGATRMMVIIQFLAEATMLSIVGGIIGIFLGWSLTGIISAYAGWRTIMSAWSILLAFTVAVATGILFGYYPAKQAAEEDVIDALRYE